MTSAPAHVSADYETPQVVPARPSWDYFNSWEVGADERPFHSRQSVQPIPILYPLSRLGDRVLRRPLVVVVESEGNSVIVSSPKLRLWGIGSDAYEALANLESTFADVVESYRQTPHEELSEGAVEYLNQLCAYWPE